MPRGGRRLMSGLAEAREDRAFKRHCLERALACEPDNVQIRQGLNQLLEQPAPPEHLPPMRPKAEKSTELEQAPIVVGVDGGLNGLASGVFVGRDGLLATTSYAMGGAEKATVYLDGERKLAGSVARRYPQVDLALIATPLDLARKPSVAPPGHDRGEFRFCRALLQWRSAARRVNPGGAR